MSHLQVWPMHDRIVLERLPAPQRLIILTDAEKERKFKVIAVGPKCKEVKPGHIVVLPGVASNEPDYEAGSRIFAREEDVGVFIG